MKKLITLVMVAAMFAATDASSAEISDLMPVLRQVKKDINSTLSEIDNDLKDAAKKLSAIDMKGDAARQILNNLCKYRPYVIDCSIIDANGIKVAVEPAQYKQYEGADRSDLPSVIALLKTRKPAMSDVYHSAEGAHAISIGYPILSDKGELMGAVRMLIRHETFLKPLAEGKPCKVWIMQPNGLIIYDPDPEEIGKNIFTDPLFKSFKDLISFSKTVALSNAGAGSYDFYANGLEDKTLVKKVAVWDTVGLHGTEWRVVVMEIEKTLEEKEPETKTQ